MNFYDNYSMVNLYFIETNFLTFALIFQILFALVTLMISLISFKIFGLTGKERTGYFGIAYLLISASYGVQAFYNMIILSKLDPRVLVMLGIHPVSVFFNQGLYFHVFLMTLGLSLLLYSTFKTRNKKILSVLVLTAVLLQVYSNDLLASFFIISTIYSFFLLHYFHWNHTMIKTSGSFLIFMSFLFLFLGQLMFYFVRLNIFFYSLAHILNLIAYLLMLYNLYLIFKK